MTNKKENLSISGKITPHHEPELDQNDPSNDTSNVIDSIGMIEG
jgi:hypothetical protein